MLCVLIVASSNSNENTTMEIKTENLESLYVNIKFTNYKEKTNNHLINDSELLWRSQVLKIIRGI